MAKFVLTKDGWVNVDYIVRIWPWRGGGAELQTANSTHVLVFRRQVDTTKLPEELFSEQIVVEEITDIQRALSSPLPRRD
jgi:hypothetical protein